MATVVLVWKPLSMNLTTKHFIAKAGATGIMMLTSVNLALAQGQPINVGRPDSGVSSIGGLITGLINAAVIIAALLTFVFLIWGGIQWLTSGGDKAAYEAARGRITAALIGLAIVAAAYALMEIIGYFFGVDPFSLNFGRADDFAN